MLSIIIQTNSHVPYVTPPDSNLREQRCTSSGPRNGGRQLRSVPAVPSVPVDLPAVPSVPVDLPAVPSVPVELPAVPSVPSELPAVPSVPVELPAVPSVPVELPAVPSVRWSSLQYRLS